MDIKKLYYYDKFGREISFICKTEKEFRTLRINLLEETLTKAIDVVYYLNMSTGVVKQLDYYNYD